MLKKKISPKIPLFFGVIPFLMAGIDAISRGNSVMIIANFSLVAANLIALKLLKTKSFLINAILMLLNGIMSLLISYDYYQLGKIGLPYAWLFISLLNFFASIMLFRKYFRPSSDNSGYIKRH